MSEQTNRERLDAVLEAYIEAVPEPSHRTLTEWIQRYPEFADELTVLTVGRLVAPFEVEPEEGVDEAALQRDLQVMRGALQRRRQPQALTSLSEAGKAVGLASIKAIAQRANLSAALVRKLDLRLMHVASLPAELFTQLAQALQVGVDALRQYLQGQPLMPEGNFKSEQHPAVPEPEDFFDAVRKDPSLTEEQRQYWLSLKS
jgi:hypothetical protein